MSNNKTNKNVLWLSLPDENKADELLLDELEKGDSWTTDVDQAARLSKLGYTVKRRDRHIVTGLLIETDIATDVLEYSCERNIEMRGDPELNRTNEQTQK